VRIPFTYVPTIETKIIELHSTWLNQSQWPTSDTHLSGPGTQEQVSDTIRYEWALLGGKGDDRLFEGVRLDTGWTVVAVSLNANVKSGKAGASIVESRVGTDMPYLKVHWWGELLSKLDYSVRITVQGPEGTAACRQCTGHFFGGGKP
jgi:hypothetical protein